MCQICAQFNPFRTDCDYAALADAPPITEIAGADADAVPGGDDDPGQPLGVTLNEGADAPGSTATPYAMAAGDYFFGTLGSSSDSDWVAVNLVAGQTYTFAMVGVGALNDSVNDTYLYLRDAGGAIVTENDDGGPGLFSTITFTAGATGTYYLDAQSWSSSPGGDYGLSMTLGDRASYDIEMGAGALMRPDASWSGLPGTGATVSWGIRATGPAFDAGGLAAPFSVLSAAQIAAAEAAMAYYDGISGLNFTRVNPGGTTDSATMLFGAYTSASDGAGAYAYYPGSTAFGSDAGDVWLNNDSVSTTSLPIGSYDYFTVLHEIGHAVGLAHPGDYDAAPGVNFTYEDFAQFIEDSHQYTVMSYFDESETTTSVFSYPDTLLLYDLYAVHQLYGANPGYMAGDTTYGFNATVAGGAYDFTVNTDPLLSIYDGAGIDTLDVSGFGMAQAIDLRAGRFSDIGGFQGNVSIAIGALIENAKGGGAADTITGNYAANALRGQGGADTLRGGGNNDYLAGGLGEDRLFGGLGDDLMYGNQGADRMFGANQHDRMFGGLGNDSLYGEGGIDELHGEVGDDFLSGGWFSDRLYGGDGRDRLNGDGGHDWQYGGSGNDRLYGGAGHDRLFGGTGNDDLYAQNGDDRMFGAAGDDRLYGGTGNDRLYGEGGRDILNGDAGNDTLTGGWFSDRFVFAGAFGQDVITDFQANNLNEVIDLRFVSAITDLADLIADHMSQVGADVMIDDLAGNTITVRNVTLAEMSDGNDFLF